MQIQRQMATDPYTMPTDLVTVRVHLIRVAIAHTHYRHLLLLLVIHTEN